MIGCVWVFVCRRGVVTKLFFFFSWEPLQLTSCWHHRLHYCQCAYFLKGPELCGSLLCQGFLAKILICLPSRLQSGFSFVWLEPCGHWGKASWVLSPFQDILSLSLRYSIKTTHYTAAPRPLPQISAADATTPAPLDLNSQFLSHHSPWCIFSIFFREDIWNTALTWSQACWWNDRVGET